MATTRYITDKNPTSSLGVLAGASSSAGIVMVDVVGKHAATMTRVTTLHKCGPGCVAGGQLHIFAVDSQFARTSDGVTWTTSSNIGGEQAYWYTGVRQFNGQLISLGTFTDTASGNAVASSSDDGLTWGYDDAPMGFQPRCAEITGSTLFVFGAYPDAPGTANFATTTDLVNWTTGTLWATGTTGAVQIRCSTIFGTSILTRGWPEDPPEAYGRIIVHKTDDMGSSWTSSFPFGEDADADSSSYSQIAASDTLAIVVHGPPRNLIASSSDGVSWTTGTIDVAEDVNEIVWNGSVFVASIRISSSLLPALAFSNDGQTWTTSSAIQGFSDVYSAWGPTWPDVFGQKIVTYGIDENQMSVSVCSEDSGSTWQAYYHKRPQLVLSSSDGTSASLSVGRGRLSITPPESYGSFTEFSGTIANVRITPDDSNNMAGIEVLGVGQNVGGFFTQKEGGSSYSYLTPGFLYVAGASGSFTLDTSSPPQPTMYAAPRLEIQSNVVVSGTMDVVGSTRTSHLLLSSSYESTLQTIGDVGTWPRVRYSEAAQVFMAEVYESGAYQHKQSSDGVTWNTVYTHTDGDQPIKMIVTGSQVFVFGTQMVKMSNDSGLSWSIGGAYPISMYQFGSAAVNNDRTLFVELWDATSVGGNRFCLSYDSGSTWAVSGVIPAAGLTYAVEPSGSGFMCAILSSTVSMFYNSDDGITWSTGSVIGGGGADVDPYTLKILPSGRMVCVTSYRMWYSDDGGSTWSSGASTMAPYTFDSCISGTTLILGSSTTNIVANQARPRIFTTQDGESIQEFHPSIESEPYLVLTTIATSPTRIAFGAEGANYSYVNSTDDLAHWPTDVVLIGPENDKERVVIDSRNVHITGALTASEIFVASLTASAYCGLPFDLGVFYPGNPSVSGTMVMFIATRPTTFPANFAGSYGRTRTTGTTSTAIGVYLNDIVVGTATFATSDLTCSFDSPQLSMSAGDWLELRAPGTIDAPRLDYAFALVGSQG